jgi:UDP-N-acetylglucosamine--N-acetylmuramyl-(pentapeptide) pyrophosphoryl-undecaprenol N-acetylglucosamine transferase
MSSNKPIRVIISGGGTGGHIFPAVAIAQTLQRIDPTVELLFVGAEGKMEMTKVPAAGYKIIGLPIVGIQRRLTLKNLMVPFRIVQSLWRARSVIGSFQPDIAIGVGGYASGPLLRMAGWMGIPTLIQEQNSYPGVTNKILARKAIRICVAYDGLQKYFPAEKIVLTGNPVRPLVLSTSGKRDQGLVHFNLDHPRKTILVIGGSLGARTINESVERNLEAWQNAGLQIIWQTGKAYFAQAQKSAANFPHVRVFDFIAEMDLAYGVADLIVSRAGAMSISELCIVGKPCILVPSPNVAEDHQTKNAMALVNNTAAVLVADRDAREQLGHTLLQLAQDHEKCQQLSANISKMAQTNASDKIADTIFSIINEQVQSK